MTHDTYKYRKAKKGEIPCVWCDNCIEPDWTYAKMRRRPAYLNLRCRLSDSGQLAVAKGNTCDNASLVTDECKIKRRKEYLREICGFVEASKLEKKPCLLSCNPQGFSDLELGTRLTQIASAIARNCVKKDIAIKYLLEAARRLSKDALNSPLPEGKKGVKLN